MKRILSTGDPERDAKLVSEALGETNARSREEDIKRFKAANEEQATQTRNALVDTPHNEGEVLLVLPDDDEDDNVKVKEGQAKPVTFPSAPAVVQHTISQPEKKLS